MQNNLPVTIDSNVLVKSDWDYLLSISNELNHAFTHRQIFRTDTEARVSVLDKIHFPTKASKYWQALREQTVMLEQLALLSFDYRRNEVEILRQTKALNTEDELDRMDAQINLDECIFKRANMKTTAADRIREIRMWSQIKSELNDGTFDINNVNTHQLESYATEFALTAGTVDPMQLSSSEAINLAGKLQTTMDRCKELGVYERVMENLPIDIRDQFLLVTQ